MLIIRVVAAGVGRLCLDMLSEPELRHERFDVDPDPRRS
jgi:hypothetical protein